MFFEFRCPEDHVDFIESQAEGAEHIVQRLCPVCYSASQKRKWMLKVHSYECPKCENMIKVVEPDNGRVANSPCIQCYEGFYMQVDPLNVNYNTSKASLYASIEAELDAAFDKIIEE